MFEEHRVTNNNTDRIQWIEIRFQATKNIYLKVYNNHIDEWNQFRTCLKSSLKCSYSKHQSDQSFDLLQSDFEHHPCPKRKKDSIARTHNLGDNTSWVSSFCYNIFFYLIIAFPLAICIGLNHIRCFVLLYFCKIERKLFLLIFCIKSTDQKKKVNIYVEIDKNHLICNTVFYLCCC